MSRKKKQYSLALKLEAIRLSETGLTHAEVTERLDIRDPKRVKNWRWQYKREGIFWVEKATSRQTTQTRERRSLYSPFRNGE